MSAWDQFFDSGENVALVGSTLVHVIIILSLAMVPLVIEIDEQQVLIVSKPPIEIEEELIDEIVYSDQPQTEVGADSIAESAIAEAAAESFAEISVVPQPLDLEPVDFGDIMVNKLFDPAVAPLERLANQKGSVGEGTTGAAGAVDRITFEILKQMEQQPTLVVWLFDQSGSLQRQRQVIVNRFDRIYDELGIARESGAKGFRSGEEGGSDPPLLTSVIGFGDRVELYTDEPTDDLDEIKSVVDNIKVDSSGTEKVFTAINAAANQYKHLCRSIGDRAPRRKVMMIVVTDERGDDESLLETSIRSCQKLGVPVYVIGVPAPFGRQHTLVKYVDPDPKFDQTPQFAQVDQGPETVRPERIQIGFTADFRTEPVIDSGFGPFALTRLCYETGGIYFTVHPNRNTNRRVRRRELDPFASELQYFFDAEVMARYRPDYLSARDYDRQVLASPLRRSLREAANFTKPITGLSRPRLRFVRREQAQLDRLLSEAQKDGARLEPTLNRVDAILRPGLKFRDQEESPRWRAGYDLAMGRVLAQRVRTTTYNAMLAQIRRGRPFENPQNNTWVLRPSDEINVGSRWKNEAELAKQLLQDVVRDHRGTPWALLAKQELSVPIGWSWSEEFTALTPPEPRRRGNNMPRPPTDDRARQLQRAPKRPVPKL